MNDPLTTGMIVLLIAVFAGRLISERAYRLLSVEEKGQVMDAFSGLRKFSLVPLIVLVGGYYLLIEKARVTSFAASAVYFTLLLAYAIGVQVYIYRKMKARFPHPEFLRLHAAAQVPPIAGLLVFVAILMWKAA